jgi:LPXTG-motif cell wall-anchored protein
MKTTKMVRMTLVALLALAVLAVPAVALAKPAVATLANPAIAAQIEAALAKPPVEEPAEAPVEEPHVARLAHVNPQLSHVISQVTTIGTPPQEPSHNTTPGISVLATRVPEPRHPSIPELPYTGGDATLWMVAGLVIAAAGAGVLFVRKPARSTSR